MESPENFKKKPIEIFAKDLSPIALFTFTRKGLKVNRVKLSLNDLVLVVVVVLTLDWYGRWCRARLGKRRLRHLVHSGPRDEKSRRGCCDRNLPRSRAGHIATDRRHRHHRHLHVVRVRDGNRRYERHRLERRLGSRLSSRGLHHRRPISRLRRLRRGELRLLLLRLRRLGSVGSRRTLCR